MCSQVPLVLDPEQGNDVRIGEHLDEESFKNFAPFLRASQRYAEISGYRFRNSSFHIETADVSEPSSAQVFPRVGRPGNDTQARQHAAPAVHSFAKRLKDGEPALLEELDRAFRLVMTESVRNSMIGNCKQLGLFPPDPSPSNVNADDCTYEDVSSPLPVIAQRLYNDHVRRIGNAQNVDAALGKRLERRVMTAAYIVDFAAEMGVTLPEVPEAHAAILQDFAVLVAEWEADGSNGIVSKSKGRETCIGHEELRRWWTQHTDYAANTMALSAATSLTSCVGLGRKNVPRPG